MMLSPEVRAKIRALEIQTRRAVSGVQLGEHVSGQKGFGLEFEQLADYQVGHDIRFIDWKSSARANKMLVKEYREEKVRTVILVVDNSASQYYGSQEQRKIDYTVQLAGALALVSHWNKDLVSLVVFSDEIEYYVPPSRSTATINRILTILFTLENKGKTTSFTTMLRYLMQIKKRNALVVVCSDFIVNESYESLLAIVSKYYETIALSCQDRYEHQLPDIGYFYAQDPETKVTISIDSSSKNKSGNMLLEKIRNDRNRLFRKYSIDLLELEVDTSFIKKLISFFRQRTNSL